MASVGEDIAREILLKLPTRDLVRCGCVCKLWRSIVRDPSFRILHDTAGTEEAETLLVQEFRRRDMDLEMAVLNVTSLTPMCRFTGLDTEYSPVNACNGFLLLASALLDRPVYVCNPVTGERLEIAAPPYIRDLHRRTYAMGFSPSTRVYKLFCLSFTQTGYWPEAHASYLDAYTLGDGDGDGSWRRHPHVFRARAVQTSHTPPPPPVLVNGKLYVVIERPDCLPSHRMLVIDVAREMHEHEHDTCCLPEVVTASTEPVAVCAFQLSGQLCVATRVIGRRRINFWVMPSPPPSRGSNWRTPRWERRYAFYLDADDDGLYGDKPCCAWLDHRDGMLCYRFGDRLYKYDTTKKTRPKHRIQLPDPDDDQRWSVYEGYHPSLLSPHISLPADSSSLLQEHREIRQEDYSNTLLQALRCRQQPSKKRCSTRPPDCSNNHRGAKRIREPTP